MSIPSFLLAQEAGILVSTEHEQETTEISSSTSNSKTPSLLSPSSAASIAPDFIIEPSVTSTTYRAGIKTKRISYACILASGGVIPYAEIQITDLQTVVGSGGHNHNDNRPTGSFSVTEGNSGPTGWFATTYTAPEVAGDVTFKWLNSD